MDHSGRILEGKVKLWNEELFRYDCEQHNGKGVILTLKSDRGKRSSRQNRYLFGVCYKMIADRLGYTPEEVHEYCKGKFLAPEGFTIIDKTTGEVIEQASIPASTRELSTTEFSEYVQQIQRWAAEVLEISIPDPNQEERETL